MPTGTVTLLLSDIEGSTRLLLHLGDAYLGALKEHREILRDAVDRCNGVVVDSRGDEVFAAFASAADAVRAATEAQRALRDHAWPEGGTIRVRMALHTGNPRRTPDGYAGLDVHRLARLCAAGHGGQVLLSQATLNLVSEGLPPDLEVRDLGEHRLRDLPRPERVYQLAIPGLQQEFPPPRAVGAPGGLPGTRRVLIGRDRELNEVHELVLDEATRLLTLTGPGGTGKTLLSLHVAASLVDQFPDGVHVVPLAAVENASHVAAAVARELRVREARDESLADTVAGALRSRRALLVLDNFEHVMEAAGLVAELLLASPDLKILVTSREVLHVAGEVTYSVPPLAMPGPGAAEAPGRAVDFGAVRLFVERATEHRPDFMLTDANAPVVVEICRRLDGLPLAIELAASRVRLLPPRALLIRLERRLPLLTGGPRDLPARQQTLRSTIAWSYDLLAEDERALFRSLAPFVGGCSLEAAERVAGGEASGEGREASDDAAPLATHHSPLATLDGLASLLDKSLILQETEGDGEPRLGMLETIREYATEQLEASGEAPAVRRRHAEYYRDLAEEAAPALGGPGQAAWLDRLDRELDNLRAALAYAEESGDAELSARLGGALWRFWSARGYLAEGRRWLDRVPTGSGASHPARIAALFGAGRLAWEQGDYAAAATPLDDSLRLAREQGDRAAVAAALTQLGHVSRSLGDFDTAQARYDEGLSIRRALGDRAGIAQSLGSMGNVALLRGDLGAARSLYEECLGIMRRAGDPRDVVNALHKLGDIAHEEGDYATAGARYGEALTLARGSANRRAIAYALEGLAGVAASQGHPERALRLAGAASALRTAIGAPAEPGTGARLERRFVPAREALGEASAAAAWSAGAELSPDQAAEEALTEVGATS